MAIYVNTNVSSLTGRNSLNNVQNQLTTTYQRLSTGMRINSAKDDAAGLQIADRLTTQINGLNQGNRNASDGIALAQTAEGAMDEISTMLQKIRTLAVQSATGTNTSDDREAINKEAASLVDEITRIATQTTYGGKTILEGGKILLPTPCSRVTPKPVPSNCKLVLTVAIRSPLMSPALYSPKWL